MNDGLGESPLVGWRVWRLEEGRLLSSWAMSHVWLPGENVARCLSTDARCERSPGQGCHCGYWALNDPAGCLRLASSRVEGGHAVLGLITAWGEIALHGSEGFRAQRAQVACLFTDSLFKPPLVDLRLGERTRRWRRWLRQKTGLNGRPWKARREVEQAASNYSVPALPLAGAIEIGLLEEFGVGRGLIRELDEKIHAAA